MYEFFRKWEVPTKMLDVLWTVKQDSGNIMDRFHSPDCPNLDSERIFQVPISLLGGYTAPCCEGKLAPGSRELVSTADALKNAAHLMFYESSRTPKAIEAALLALETCKAPAPFMAAVTAARADLERLKVHFEFWLASDEAGSLLLNYAQIGRMVELDPKTLTLISILSSGEKRVEDAIELYRSISVDPLADELEEIMLQAGSLPPRQGWVVAAGLEDCDRFARMMSSRSLAILDRHKQGELFVLPAKLCPFPLFKHTQVGSRPTPEFMEIMNRLFADGMEFQEAYAAAEALSS